MLAGQVDASGSFRPQDGITRAEFAKIACNAFGLAPVKAEGKFSDVDVYQWYAQYVEALAKAGYVKGDGDGTFRPMDKITRQEVAKILTTIMHNKDDKLDKLNKFLDANKTSDWAKSYVEGAIEAGYLGGDNNGRLNPTNNITRAEAVTVLSRLK